MPARDKRDPAALGLRVKSGWAVAVLLAGPAGSPRVLDRREIALSDPLVPESRQPYHAGIGLAQSDAVAVTRLAEIVARHTRHSVGELVREYRSGDYNLCGVGIVAGSDVDPERLANPHIRAHAAEGRLFRRVVEVAARHMRLPCTTLVERRVYGIGAQALARTEDQMKRAVAALDREPGGRWRAEEKTAAAAAWLVLAQRGPKRSGSA